MISSPVFCLEFICKSLFSNSWFAEHFQDLCPSVRGFHSCTDQSIMHNAKALTATLQLSRSRTFHTVPFFFFFFDHLQYAKAVLRTASDQTLDCRKAWEQGITVARTSTQRYIAVDHPCIQMLATFEVANG